MNIQDKNLFYIGGVVRDEILGLKSFDIDITYAGNAIEYISSIKDAEILQINEPFGTVRIKLDGKIIDIASTRCETYPEKGHLPKVENIGCSLKDDILRRDFSINALAKSTLTGEIIDYTGGLQDIKNKTLRVLHDKSFIDDPTRIVRGLKFAVRFNFELDNHTLQLQNEYLNNINYDISYKRLKKELIETFNLNSWEAYNRFTAQKIYKLLSPQDFVLPEINLEPLISKYKPDCTWIIYIGLLPDISCLPLTKQEKKIVEDFKNLKQQSFDTDYEIYKKFSQVSIESVLMFATIKPEQSLRYLDKLRNIKVDITGADLLKLGISPSKKYQECFDYILYQKLENPNLQYDEIDLAKKFFNIS